MVSKSLFFLLNALATTSSHNNLRHDRNLREEMTSDEDLPVVSSAPQDDKDYSQDYSEPVVIIQNDSSDAVDGSDEEDSRFGCHSIHDIICSEGIFKTLCTLLNGTTPALGTALSEGEWTFFAPIDSAFDDNESVIDGLSLKKLMRVIKFHAHEGEVLFPWDLECSEKVLMTSGDMSRTKCETNESTVDKYQKGNGNYKLNMLPKILLPSIRACNGIIHVMDAVMIPVHGDTSESAATAVTDDEVVQTSPPTDGNETYSQEYSNDSDGDEEDNAIVTDVSSANVSGIETTSFSKDNVETNDATRLSYCPSGFAPFHSSGCAYENVANGPTSQVCVCTDKLLTKCEIGASQELYC